MRQFTESLESRTHFTVTIPVYGLHAVVAATPDANRGLAISQEKFHQFLSTLESDGFTPITLQRYYDWHEASDKSTVPMPSRPCVLMFDDGNYSDSHLAFDEMNQFKSQDPNPLFNNKRFVGVAAIRTDFVTKETALIDKKNASPNHQLSAIDQSTLDSYMETYGSWYDYKKLISAGWDYADHSWSHGDLGVKTAKRSANTEELVNRETTRGYADLEAALKNYPDAKWSTHALAFVHPFDDATAYSIRVAAANHKMVFGSDSPNLTVGAATNLTSGDLIRIGVSDTTFFNTPNFPYRIDKSVRDGVATVATNVKYPTSYLARDGAIMIEGTDGSDDIDLTSTRLHSATVVTVNFQNSSTPFTYSSTNYYDGKTTPVAVTASSFKVFGNAGNDIITITGFLGSRVTAGSGNDTVIGGTGKDTIMGGDGNDSILGGDGGDYLYGANGNDYIDGGGNSDVIYGESGSDTLLGGAGTGNDSLYGGIGNDLLRGGAGNDLLVGGDNVDSLYGEDGDDALWSFQTTSIGTVTGVNNGGAGTNKLNGRTV